jgi:hypothetical protein
VKCGANTLVELAVVFVAVVRDVALEFVECKSDGGAGKRSIDGEFFFLECFRTKTDCWMGRGTRQLKLVRSVRWKDECRGARGVNSWFGLDAARN